MKKIYILIISILALFIFSGLYYFYDWAVQMGGGSGRPIGGIAPIELNCSESDAKQELEDMSIQNTFKVSESDSSIVQYWERNGYDFLNYVCINIQGRLYMISISPESELSIRAYYSRKNEKWIFAAEFSSPDKKEAKKAQEYLLKI